MTQAELREIRREAAASVRMLGYVLLLSAATSVGLLAYLAWRVLG